MAKFGLAHGKNRFDKILIAHKHNINIRHMNLVFLDNSNSKKLKFKPSLGIFDMHISTSSEVALNNV
jgi:hypothetical protein